MAEIIKSTMRSRALGDELRIVMERANITGKRLAERLGWSETRVSRILTGMSPASDLDTASVLALCDVTGERREALLKLAGVESLYHWETPRNALAGQMYNVARITELQEVMVPNLLQTPDYARSILSRTTTFSSEEMDSWITKTERGQSICNNIKGPACTFFVHERVLGLPVGNKAVMSKQLGRLLTMGARRNISIRVVPVEFGAYPGMGNPFRLLEFANGLMPATYDEDEVAGYFDEDHKRIECVKQVISGLGAVAYDKDQSRDTIQRILTDQYFDDGDRDDAEHALAG